MIQEKIEIKSDFNRKLNESDNIKIGHSFETEKKPDWMVLVKCDKPVLSFVGYIKHLFIEKKFKYVLLKGRGKSIEKTMQVA